MPKQKTMAQATTQLAKIRLLSLDVDGVLTDGGIYYSDKGITFRKFNAQDGMGLVRLQKIGIGIIIISAGAPGAIEHRAKRLGIQNVFTNVLDKKKLLSNHVKSLGGSLSEVAHMGDDVNDLPVMAAVGTSIAPANAVLEVINAADIVTNKKGGNGAVRELCDAIYFAQRHEG